MRFFLSTPRPGIPLLRASLLALATLLGITSCLAPAPPAMVQTPYGEVRAENSEKAERYARLLEELAPQVCDLLPGSQSKPIDIWIQDRLQVYRGRERSEGVRGFTLLHDEFDAWRIHLQDGGQSAWYLSHELAHALIGKQWAPLPGLLEEGLADVVAELLNPDNAEHIRAHRLLNASAFTGGFDVSVAYSWPDQSSPASDWERRTRSARVQTADPVQQETMIAALGCTRSELHTRWPELPESFYGLAWLMVSRIVERRGLDGLLDLCHQARQRGQDTIPVDTLAAAAEMDLARLSPEFLSACFTAPDLRAAASLRPEIFTGVATEALRPWESRFGTRALLRYINPTLVTTGGDEIRFAYVGALRAALYSSWRRYADEPPRRSRESHRGVTAP